MVGLLWQADTRKSLILCYAESRINFAGPARDTLKGD